MAHEQLAAHWTATAVALGFWSLVTSTTALFLAHCLLPVLLSWAGPFRIVPSLLDVAALSCVLTAMGMAQRRLVMARCLIRSHATSHFERSAPRVFMSSTAVYVVMATVVLPIVSIVTLAGYSTHSLLTSKGAFVCGAAIAACTFQAFATIFGQERASLPSAAINGAPHVQLVKGIPSMTRQALFPAAAGAGLVLGLYESQIALEPYLPSWIANNLVFSGAPLGIVPLSTFVQSLVAAAMSALLLECSQALSKIFLSKLPSVSNDVLHSIMAKSSRCAPYERTLACNLMRKRMSDPETLQMLYAADGTFSEQTLLESAVSVCTSELDVFSSTAGRLLAAVGVAQPSWSRGRRSQLQGNETANLPSSSEALPRPGWSPVASPSHASSSRRNNNDKSQGSHAQWRLPVRLWLAKARLILRTTEFWFAPRVTARDALQLLKDEENGTFLVHAPISPTNGSNNSHQDGSAQFAITVVRDAQDGRHAATSWTGTIMSAHARLYLSEVPNCPKFSSLPALVHYFVDHPYAFDYASRPLLLRNPHKAPVLWSMSWQRLQRMVHSMVSENQRESGLLSFFFGKNIRVVQFELEDLLPPTTSAVCLIGALAHQSTELPMQAKQLLARHVHDILASLLKARWSIRTFVAKTNATKDTENLEAPKRNRHVIRQRAHQRGAFEAACRQIDTTLGHLLRIFPMHATNIVPAMSEEERLELAHLLRVEELFGLSQLSVLQQQLTRAPQPTSLI